MRESGQSRRSISKTLSSGSLLSRSSLLLWPVPTGRKGASQRSSFPCKSYATSVSYYVSKYQSVNHGQISPGPRLSILWNGGGIHKS